MQNNITTALTVYKEPSSTKNQFKRSFEKLNFLALSFIRKRIKTLVTYIVILVLTSTFVYWLFYNDCISSYLTFYLISRVDVKAFTVVLLTLNALLAASPFRNFTNIITFSLLSFLLCSVSVFFIFPLDFSLTQIYLQSLICFYIFVLMLYLTYVANVDFNVSFHKESMLLTTKCFLIYFLFNTSIIYLLYLLLTLIFNNILIG